MRKNGTCTLTLTLAFLMTTAGCSTYAAVPTIAITITENTSATEITEKPTETAAAASSETTAETTGETPAVTTSVTAVTTVGLPVVTVLAEPAAYAASFDTVRIYTDASRTQIQSILTKGDQVIITGTADKYGVTAEGYYVNMNLMTLIITITPTAAEISTATTKETVKPTTKPTKATDAETDAPVATTVAPPPTAAPAYAENCDAIRTQIIQYCVDNGLWFPDEEVNGDGSVGWTVGYGSADNQYADSFISGKIFGDEGVQSVSCWIADGYIYISYTTCKLPAA